MPAPVLHRRQIVTAAGAALLLAACGKEEEPPGSASVALVVTGGPGLNSGQNRPVTLRLLRLKDSGPFLAATYADLADPAAWLGPALLGMSELIVSPGAVVPQTVAMEPEATALGLMALLMDPSGRVWNAVIPTPPGAMVTAAVTIGPAGILLTTGG